MRIIDTDPKRLHLEGRRLPNWIWFAWGLLFLAGFIPLLGVPESYRFVGLIAWMGIWLGFLALAPRWLGELVRVSVDASTHTIVWTRNGHVTQTINFADIQQFDILILTTSTRPYKAFQLVAHLTNSSRITLAVDPKEEQIQHVLKLVRDRVRIR